MSMKTTYSARFGFAEKETTLTKMYVIFIYFKIALFNRCKLHL